MSQAVDQSLRLIDQLAAAPISWGVCEVPDWGVQLPVERVLAEMADLGFSQTELGAAGYLPEDPAVLRSVLADHGLNLIGGFVPLVVHDPSELEATRRTTHEQAELLRDAGATYFITAAVTDWNWGPRRELTDGEWEHAYAVLAEVETTVRDYGLVQAMHPHIGTIIERADEVQRVLDNTTVGWTLDTGHLLIGGYDPLDFARNYTSRIRHVHLKDVVMDLALPVLAGEQTIMEGVQAGMFCNLGAGDVNIEAAIDHMVGSGFDGWYVIEQDAAIDGDVPAPSAGPVKDVAASVNFLRGLAASEIPVRNTTTNNN